MDNGGTHNRTNKLIEFQHNHRLPHWIINIFLTYNWSKKKLSETYTKTAIVSTHPISHIVARMTGRFVVYAWVHFLCCILLWRCLSLPVCSHHLREFDFRLVLTLYLLKTSKNFLGNICYTKVYGNLKQIVLKMHLWSFRGHSFWLFYFDVFSSPV